MSQTGRPRIDVVRLCGLTSDATRKQTDDRVRAALLAREQEERERRLNELKADIIIAQIAGRADAEALAGRNHAIVMSLDSYDYDRPHSGPDCNDWNRCHPQWLKDVAKSVYEYCTEQGLNPSIEFWHDGVGVNSGFNIVIHWSK